MKHKTRNRVATIPVIAVALLCSVTSLARATELAILSNGFSIRHEHRLVMGATTRLYLSVDDSSFIDEPTANITGYEKDLSLPAAATPSVSGAAVPSAASVASAKSAPNRPSPPMNEVVNTASAEYHLDPDLVNSVIHAESGFNAHAVSPKGARGLMQLMPNTASQLGVNNAFDPQDNVQGGSRYLRELLERYNFDLVKALAAYNAGPDRVEQYNGVPPFRETRAYVARIVREYNVKKAAQEKQEKEEKRKQLAAKTLAAKTTKTPKPASKPANTAVTAESR
jgi:SLT domain-containing protein